MMLEPDPRRHCERRRYHSSPTRPLERVLHHPSPVPILLCLPCTPRSPFRAADPSLLGHSSSQPALFAMLPLPPSTLQSESTSDQFLSSIFQSRLSCPPSLHVSRPTLCHSMPSQLHQRPRPPQGLRSCLKSAP